MYSGWVRASKELDRPIPPPNIDDLQITKDMVRLYLGNINITNSAGPDEIHPASLKPLADLLAWPSCKLYKVTLPPVAILAIHEDGSRLEVGKCRPVSLTSVL